MRGSAVDTNAAGVAFAGDDVGLQPRTVGVIYYLYAFAGIDIGSLHERFVNSDRTDIIEVSLGYLYAVNL